MGTFLHLSDLHLAGPEAAGDVTGDYKVDAVLPADRQRRTSVIRHTLEQLGAALLAAQIRLDAVVITGDVTTHARAEGIELLPDVLGRLGDALPANDRIRGTGRQVRRPSLLPSSTPASTSTIPNWLRCSWQVEVRGVTSETSCEGCRAGRVCAAAGVPPFADLAAHDIDVTLDALERRERRIVEDEDGDPRLI
jgi:hypothetical protein